MVCGPGRAGKSSLIDSLRNKPISKKKDSTPGVSLSKATCHITEEDGRCDWPKETDDQTHQQLFLTESLSSASDSPAQVPTDSTAAQESQMHERVDQVSPRPHVSPSNDQTKRQRPPASRSDASGEKQGTHRTRSKRTALEQVSKQLSTARKQQMKVPLQQRKRQKTHFLDIWDFGGQQAYAFLHHMLLSDGRCQLPCGIQRVNTNGRNRTTRDLWHGRC